MFLSVFRDESHHILSYLHILTTPSPIDAASSTLILRLWLQGRVSISVSIVIMVAQENSL